VRAPEATREKLVAAAFEEIHRRGYQAASLDTILATAGVTKGALYHHFDDKAALGFAVFDEVVRRFTMMRWTVTVSDDSMDPIDALQLTLRTVATEFSDERRVAMVMLGCPLNNIAQEMSPLDERFRDRITAAFDLWTDAFTDALERGRAAGTVRADVDAKKVSAFIVAAIEGSFGLAKSAQSAALLSANLDVLSGFLDGLRATPAPARRTAAKSVRRGRAR
jgi:AcrR family transcriptional regulator